MITPSKLVAAAALALTMGIAGTAVSASADEYRGGEGGYGWRHDGRHFDRGDFFIREQLRREFLRREFFRHHRDFERSGYDHRSW